MSSLCSSGDLGRSGPAQEQLTNDVAQRLLVEEKDKTGEADQDDWRQSRVEAGMKAGEDPVGNLADKGLKQIHGVTGSSEQEHGSAGEQIGEPTTTIGEAIDGPAKAADSGKGDESVSDTCGDEGTACKNACGGDPVIGDRVRG